MGAQPHPTRPERLRPPARKPEAALVALLLLLVAAVVPVPCGAQQRSSAAPPAAASPPAPPPADLPSLAELVPKARELGEDGARLETRIVKITDVREAEASLAVLRERHAAAAAALKELETAGDYTLDRLTRLRESFRQDAAAVDAVVGDLTGRMEEIEGDRKRWSELHAVWSAWEAQVPKKDAGAAVRVTFSEARASLAHAAGLLSQAVPQVVPVQRRAVELQAQFQELRTKVEGLVSAIKGGLFGRWAWPMYSEQFRDQLRASLDLGLVASPARFTALRNQVSPSWGWLALVHVLLFAGFSFALRWSRTAGVHGETWRGLLERPFAAGAIAGALIPVAFYSPFQKLPAFVAFALSLCAALATARLAPRLIASRVLRRALFVVVGVFLADRFFRFVGLPTPPLRVWNALTGAAGSVLCFVGSARWRRRGEPAALLFACRAAGTLFAVACAGQVLGYTSLGFRLTDGLLWSTFLVPLGWIFSLLLRGSAELLLDRAALARWPLLRTRRDEILRTLGIVTDGASLCLFAAIFLVVWRVLDTPREAIAFLLDLGVAWGTQRFTVGLALAALAALYLSLTVSRVVQALLEGQVYPQRGVDRGAQISINRLISYAFVFVGGVVALEVLGIELGKLAVLAGALGVGIGFGLQGIVNNFVGGLILLSERPIKVGDLLQLGTEWGKVTRLGLRATTIQTFDRSEIIVPNAELVSGRVVNWTHSDRAARLVVPVGVAYGSDVAEVMRILEESAAEHPKIARDPKPQAVFLRFGESSLDFQLMAGVKDVEDRLSIQSWVLQTLERRFREAGIEIPFPQRVIRTVAAEAGPGAGRPAEPPPEGEKREESAGDP